MSATRFALATAQQEASLHMDADGAFGDIGNSAARPCSKGDARHGMARRAHFPPSTGVGLATSRPNERRPTGHNPSGIVSRYSASVHRTMKRMATVAAASLLAAFGITPAMAGVASAKGGYGLVTFDGVGPLSGGIQPVQFDGSIPSDLRAFAGKPDSVSVLSGISVNNQAAEELWTYTFPSGGRTYYTFVWSDSVGDWLLEGFQTTLQRFRTIHGTKVGISFAQAERREHVPWFNGCHTGFEHVRRNPLALVEIATDPNKTHVTGLAAYGPTPPVIC
jgi:hypothetical protein